MPLHSTLATYDLPTSTVTLRDTLFPAPEPVPLVTCIDPPTQDIEEAGALPTVIVHPLTSVSKVPFVTNSALGLVEAPGTARDIEPVSSFLVANTSPFEVKGVVRILLSILTAAIPYEPVFAVLTSSLVTVPLKL